MKYLKVFTDFAEIIDPLQDAEVGRLFKSMLAYAETGAAPDLRGNERFVWSTAKQIIDREREYSDKQAEKGKKGGRPKKPEKADESQQKPEKADESRKSQKDKDKEKYKEINSKEFTKKAATATFTPPTVEEVASYCKSRNNTVNAQAFVDYYTGRGWYLSKGVKVKDWRACVRTWEQREPKKKDRYGAESYEQHTITEDMLRDAYLTFEEDT
jgi:hypothetical protein